MNKFYTVIFGQGIERKLPLCKVTDNLIIAGFNMLGDTEVIEETARELFLKTRGLDFDVIFTAECKGIALAQEVARLFSQDRKKSINYVVARKSVKLYMKDSLEFKVTSITTKGEQSLFLAGEECDKLKSKKVLIVDDVISTGNSAEVLRKIIRELNSECVGELCVFAEGGAIHRKGIVYCKELPLFDGNGNIIKEA